MSIECSVTTECLATRPTAARSTPGWDATEVMDAPHSQVDMALGTAILLHAIIGTVLVDWTVTDGIRPV